MGPPPQGWDALGWRVPLLLFFVFVFVFLPMRELVDLLDSTTWSEFPVGQMTPWTAAGLQPSSQ